MSNKNLEKYPGDRTGVGDHSPPDRGPMAASSPAGPTEKPTPPKMPGVDGRSAEARRWRDLFMQFLTAKTCGPGMAGEHLARRAATLCIQLERMDAASARGEDVDLEAVTRLTNSFQRILEALGLTSTPEPPPVDPRAELNKILEEEAQQNEESDND